MTPEGSVKQQEVIDPIAAAEAMFLEKRRDLEKQLQGIDEMLGHLRAAKSKVVRTADSLSPVQPGQFDGMKTGRALESYLRSRPGVKIPFERALSDLKAGGANLGKNEKYHARHLKITIWNHKKLVQADKDSGEIWLAHSIK